MSYDDVSLAFRQLNASAFQLENSRTSLLIGNFANPLTGSGFATTISDHSVVANETSTNQTKQIEPQQFGNNDWERIRPIFTTLYRDKHMKLKDVMVIMRTKYDFNATENMYKKRITQWSLGRSSTHDEKAKFAALAQKCRTEGKPLPTHDEYGREIPWVKVRRQAGSRVISKDMLRNTARADRYVSQSEKHRSGYQDSPAANSTIQSQCLELTRSPVSEDVRILDNMHYHISSILSWQRSTTLSYSMISGFLRAYQDLTRMFAISPATARLKLSTAAEEISQIPPQQPLTALLDLLRIIARCSRYLEASYLLLTIRFFQKICFQKYGLDNPLALLLEQLLNLTKLFSLPKKPFNYNFVRQCRLRELIQHLHQEFPASSTKSVTRPRDFFDVHLRCIHSLSEMAVYELAHADGADEAAATLRLAERSCHELLTWSTEIFGRLHKRTMRAKMWLGTIYWFQDRVEEGRAVLEPVWKLWCQITRTHDLDGLKARSSWYPAWVLARICEDQNDVANYQLYQQNIIQFYMLKYSPLDPSVLIHLQDLVEFHTHRKNYGAIEYLAELYTDSFNELSRLRNQAS